MTRWIGITGLGFALCAVGSARAAEDFSTWAHTAKLKLNTSASGANVARSIKEFGLLVRITDSRILTQSMADGSDVRFADEKGIPLDFQIERWAPGVGKAEFWVRVPQVDSLSDKQYLNIHWGKPGSAWLSDGTKAFAASSAYWMVYHLGEGASQARTNSVGNYNHATPVNYDGDERVAGMIGMADSLDGAAKAGDYLDLGAGFTDLTGFTYNAWVRTSGVVPWERLLELANGEMDENLVIHRGTATDSLGVTAYGPYLSSDPRSPSQGATFYGKVYAGKALETGKWTFFGVTISGKNAAIFKNGVKVAEGAFASPLSKILRKKNFIGHSNWSIDGYFKGLFDEVQLSSAVRSAEWMKLAYESQRPDAKMFAWEFPPEVSLSITSQPIGVTVAEGKAVKLAVAAVSGSAIAYQWFRDGTPVAGAESAAFAIASATLAHSGMYTCRLTDGKDTVVSKSAAVFVPEELATWSHSQKVFINTTATGADLSEDVANIPILVRLGRKSIDFNQVGEGGRDLRFADKDGAALAHSIERWTNDTAEVWVRLNKVAANANGYFLMYWGKTAARQGSSPGNVFSLNDAWRFYYDFSDIPSGNGEAIAKDATLNGARGKGTAITSATDCVIGKCFSFAGSSHVESTQPAIEGLKTFTVLAWVREKTVGHAPGDIENPHLFGTRLAVAPQGEFGAYSKDGALHYWNGMHSVPPFTVHPTVFRVGDKGWHLIAITYTGNSMTLYADGNGVLSTTGENLALGPNVLSIGALRSAQGVWAGGFTGEIDAVQMTGDAKSMDWIRLAYETQRPGSDVLAFGAPADMPPPMPEFYPPAGSFADAIQVQITCAADSARIFYTLDGSEPDTVARGSTKNPGPFIPLAGSATIKAKAYWMGKSSSTAVAAYAIAVQVPVGDTLRPGASKQIDGTHRVTYPNQDTKAPVRLTTGPTWNPLPPGFDRVGPPFTLHAVETAAPFPGLAVDGDSLAGLSLFRRNPDAVILWMPPKDGQLWIPSAGTYFWGRDTLPPRIRLAGTGSLGDSLQVRIVIDDNVAQVHGMVRYWNGAQDSMGWWATPIGTELEFTVPVPAKPETALEVRFSATDQSRTVHFPESRVLTLSHPLPALAAPLNLKPGIQWRMTGLPAVAAGETTLSDLARMSGTGPLYAAIWRSAPALDTGYLILKGEDKLPVGKGFWLSSESAAPSLNFPASTAMASDSDGLFTLKLEKGWNLVSCPSFRPLAWPVSIKDGDAYLRSPLKPLHGYGDSGYNRPDSLRPWEAYYVWYDKDTLVRVGPGAPRVADRFSMAKAADPAQSLRLGLTGSGAQLHLGASTFARPGIGREDESRPPPVDDRASAWLARDGRALTVDYVAWDPERAMGWTVAARGQAAGATISVSDASLPSGFEAWAVSPSRRLKWRMLPGSNIPVTGEDTLAVYAGTPHALAKVGDLQRGRTVAGIFAARVRAASQGPELILDLPDRSRVKLSLHDIRGAEMGGPGSLEMAAGRHTVVWPSLRQGAWFLTIEAVGPGWKRRQVHAFTFFR